MTSDGREVLARKYLKAVIRQFVADPRHLQIVMDAVDAYIRVRDDDDAKAHDERMKTY